MLYQLSYSRLVDLARRAPCRLRMSRFEHVVETMRNVNAEALEVRRLRVTQCRPMDHQDPRRSPLAAC